MKLNLNDMKTLLILILLLLNSSCIVVRTIAFDIRESKNAPAPTFSRFEYPQPTAMLDSTSWNKIHKHSKKRTHETN